MPMRVEINGAELCVDTIGEPADPAVPLIMGAAGSMDRWEEPFCERLVAAGRYVIYSRVATWHGRGWPRSPRPRS